MWQPAYMHIMHTVHCSCEATDTLQVPQYLVPQAPV